jgi:3-deoxy-D-arabino-heptulosonate 7-phosphate (DAHP) synthase
VTGFTLIAGPCTVESREQTPTAARCVAAAGATMLRGGAFKPHTSPHTFQYVLAEGNRAVTLCAHAGDVWSLAGAMRPPRLAAA